jgi:hypothetical protein
MHMAVEREMKCVAGVSTTETLETGVRVAREQHVHIDLPTAIDASHVVLLQRDFEKIASIAGQYPDSMAEVQNAILNQDLSTARRVANEIGLNEDNLRANEGGQIGLAGGIIVALVIYAIATSGGDEPPPQPVIVGPEGGVPPEGGAPDAGPG